MLTIWENLDKSTQTKIKSLMPKRWKPPSGNNQPVILVDIALEQLEEIDEIMKRRPKGKYAKLIG